MWCWAFRNSNNVVPGKESELLSWLVFALTAAAASTVALAASCLDNATQYIDKSCSHDGEHYNRLNNT